MKVEQGEYFTVAEMCRILGESTNTIKSRIKRAGLKAFTKDALYTASDFETVKNTPGKGRPKKTPDATAGKKPPVKTKKKTAAKKSIK